MLVSVDRSNFGLSSYQALIKSFYASRFFCKRLNSFSVGTLAVSLETADIDSDTDLDYLQSQTLAFLNYLEMGRGTFASIDNISTSQGNITAHLPIEPSLMMIFDCRRKRPIKFRISSILFPKPLV